ncbi:LuxR C-terminal-related transcriptional regulator [Mycolicibacterium smegmatis]|uniref:LuxR C-terminal-related transcriptional regulator n=1 Tax=Mycolicibacterium smegmatis TaxID=1772 RepID=UPI0013032C55|nr:LuxR C-terminal-related transcriptional regulator [Mycolicibacterium smegmatis]
MSGWPFVGRDDELREAAEALRDSSRGVVLAGPSGVGKTALARVLAGQLETEGYTIRYVLGTETGQAVPFGAFHHTLELSNAHEPTVMLAAAHHALAADPNVLIVVDDAQYLDPLSALLVQQLAVHGSIKLIVTMRSGATTSDAVTALWKEHLLARLDVEPFSRAQTAEVASTVLGGEVDEHAVAELHRYSSGSPMFLRGVLTAAMGDGVLVQTHGKWRLRGNLRPSPDLYELIASRVQTFSAEELDVAEVVSTADMLDWHVLLAICGPDAVARAERRGAIHVTSDGSHAVVQPGHPIIGEVVRSRCPVSRTRQINTLVAEHLSAQLRAAGDASAVDVRTRIQLARFMTRAESPPDTNLVTEAAASAVTMSDLVLGEQLARFAVEHGAGVNAALVLADAISWQGRGDEADALLARFPPDGEDDLTVTRWGCQRAANLFFVCGRPEPAWEVLAKTRDAVGSEKLAGFVTAMEVAFTYFSADMAGAAAAGSAALATEMMPAATVWVALATAGALAKSGRFSEVAAVVRTGERAASRCESGPHRYSLPLAEVLAGTLAGEFDDAQRACDRYAAASSGIPQADVMVTALAGRMKLARGQLEDACELLQAAVWSMAAKLPPGWPMLVASWLAQAEGARGNAEAADVALTKAEAEVGPQVEVFAPELELARAWRAAAAGETSRAQHHAVLAAQNAHAAGMTAVELTALHTSTRFGDRSVDARIQQLATELDCPLGEAIALHSSGLAGHDGHRLVTAADRFERIGAMVLAGDAAAHASREFGRRGERGNELEASTRAHWLASRCGAVTPALRCAADPLPLTPREWEIANLVSSGLSNRQVADRLCLSVRTVDGHLYRMFAKLGVADRDQLAKLIRFRPAT